MNKLNTIEEFDQAVMKDEKVILLKHSATCPISSAAYHEFEKFVTVHGEISAYYLVVQDSRRLSNYIADQYQIKHESPQTIIFSGNKPAWNTSHWDITEKTLEKMWQEHN